MSISRNTKSVLTTRTNFYFPLFCSHLNECFSKLWLSISLSTPFEGEGVELELKRIARERCIALTLPVSNVYCNFEKYIKMLAMLLTRASLQGSRYYFSTEEGSTASNEGREVKMGCLLSFYTRSSIITSIYKIVSLKNWPPYEILIPCNLFLPFLYNDTNIDRSRDSRNSIRKKIESSSRN